MTEVFQFDHPQGLWLLLLVLVVLVFAWTSRRRVSRRRLVLSSIIRLLFLLGLIAAVSGLNHGKFVDDLGVVFVMDRSASVSEGGRKASRS